MASKRERKIQQIKKWLPRCSPTWSVYVYGAIPKKIFEGACSSYAGTISYKDTFGIIDETLFGNGKKGMVFTEQGYYYTYSGTNAKFVKYSQLKTMNGWSGYNCQALNELLEKLYNIETEASGLEVAAGLFGAFMGLCEEISDWADEIEINENENQAFLAKNNYIEGDATEMTENDVAVQMKKLKTLYEEGLITSEEFKYKKQELLDRL